jgi:hypothetical protein
MRRRCHAVILMPSNVRTPGWGCTSMRAPASPHWHGERMDLADAVTCLYQRELREPG